MKGQFIVIEGPDGSGTTRHTALLGERLRKEGIPVLMTAEPSDGKVGTVIRDLLREKPLPPPDALQLLFCADRAEHLAHVVLPARTAGTTVISDRYAHSTIAYGSALGLDPVWLQSLNKNFIQSDRVVFTLPPLSICRERLGRRPAQDELEGEDIQTRVYRAYQNLAKADPSIIVVDTSGEKEEVAERIYEAITG